MRGKKRYHIGLLYYEKNEQQRLGSRIISPVWIYDESSAGNLNSFFTISSK